MPWRYAKSLNLNIPLNLLNTTAGDTLKLQQGYMQGSLYQYAPNVNVLHCPADLRANSPAATFAWGSYSGAAAFNGSPYPTNTPITTQAGILHASERYLWLEENDPRGENQGSWVMNNPGPPPGTTTSFEDSVANWHGGSTSTFSWADGHAESHRWLDGPTIVYATSMDPEQIF